MTLDDIYRVLINLKPPRGTKVHGKRMSHLADNTLSEAACGELRTHYAGFFDPGFGYGRGELHGTQVVLEVRPHDVPFLIHDGQTFFKVVYDRMLARPNQLYGTALGSSYQRQGLTLSKHFKV